MDNFIYKFEKSLTTEICQNLINLFKDPRHKNKINPGPMNNQTKITGVFSYDALILGSSSAPFYKILEENISVYKKKYPYLSRRPFKIDDLCYLQKYKPGSSYSVEHCENGGNDGQLGNMSLRNLAWMFYLNDIKNDGGTCFPNQGLTLTPCSGDLYIWPAYWTHSHYGVAAQNEEKYIITGWCRYLNISENEKLFNFIKSREK